MVNKAFCENCEKYLTLAEANAGDSKAFYDTAKDDDDLSSFQYLQLALNAANIGRSFLDHVLNQHVRRGVIVTVQNELPW